MWEAMTRELAHEGCSLALKACPKSQGSRAACNDHVDDGTVAISLASHREPCFRHRWQDLQTLQHP